MGDSDVLGILSLLLAMGGAAYLIRARMLARRAEEEAAANAPPMYQPGDEDGGVQSGVTPRNAVPPASDSERRRDTIPPRLRDISDREGSSGSAVSSGGGAGALREPRVDVFKVGSPVKATLASASGDSLKDNDDDDDVSPPAKPVSASSGKKDEKEKDKPASSKSPDTKPSATGAAAAVVSRDGKYLPPMPSQAKATIVGGSTSIPVLVKAAAPGPAPSKTKEKEKPKEVAKEQAAKPKETAKAQPSEIKKTVIAASSPAASSPPAVASPKPVPVAPQSSPAPMSAPPSTKVVAPPKDAVRISAGATTPAAAAAAAAAVATKKAAAAKAIDEIPRIEVEEDEDVEPTKVGKFERRAIQPIVEKVIFDEGAQLEPAAAGAGGAKELKLVVYALAQTDPGKRRKQNEDSHLVIEKLGLYIVADGMGGHRGGQYASKLAVETMSQAFEQKKFEAAAHPNIPTEASELARAIQMSNAAILEEASKKPELKGMGTTICAARFTADRRRLYLGHVGDSRCYRVRNGVMKQMTTDHTMADYGVAGPEGAHLSRALGVWPTVPIDIVFAQPELNDVYLLCSDGLTKMLPDGTIATQLLHEEDPKAAVERLVFFANAHGGKDNITVILLRVVEPGWKPPESKRQQSKPDAF